MQVLAVRISERVHALNDQSSFEQCGSECSTTFASPSQTFDHIHRVRAELDIPLQTDQVSPGSVKMSDDDERVTMPFKFVTGKQRALRPFFA